MADRSAAYRWTFCVIIALCILYIHTFSLIITVHVIVPAHFIVHRLAIVAEERVRVVWQGVQLDRLDTGILLNALLCDIYQIGYLVSKTSAFGHLLLWQFALHMPELILNSQNRQGWEHALLNNYPILAVFTDSCLQLLCLLLCPLVVKLAHLTIL